MNSRIKTIAIRFFRVDPMVENFVALSFGALLILFMLFSMTGCSAQGVPPSDPNTIVVYYMQWQSTMKVVIDAAFGVNGTATFTNPETGNVVFAAPRFGGYGLTCVNCAVKDPVGLLKYLSGGKGYWTDIRTFQQIAAALRGAGYKEVIAKDVPGSIMGIKAAERAVRIQGITAWLNALKGSTTSIFVVPAGVLIPPAEVVGEPILD